jgi:hypothetical protein
MRYDKIQKYFDEGEVGVTQLLADCQDIFDTIDQYKQDFLGDVLSTESVLKTGLNVLTGCYFFLEPIFNLSQAYKEIKEDESYCNLRTQAELEGKKITADALKVEAHKSVNLFIRTRNIFESYVNSVEKGIITIQTLLKRMENNKDHKPQEEK